MPDMPELVHIPQDLTLLSDTDLQSLHSQAVAEFERRDNDDNLTEETLALQVNLAAGLDRVKAELAGRAERDRQNAESERQRLADERSRLSKRVLGTTDEDPGEGTPDAPAAVDAEAIAAAAAKATTEALLSVIGDRTDGSDLVAAAQRSATRTASLAEGRRFQPARVDPRPLLAVRASVDIPGVARGDSVTSLEGMAELFIRKAKSMPVTRGQENRQLVASIVNEFEHTVDDRTSTSQVQDLLEHIRRPEAQEALLAAGGWCAPSEIKYDFFNIACTSGMVDLPTVGVSRGGMKWPISPSLADVFSSIAFGGFSVTFSNTSDPWLWTETDDENAVTGSGTKPCVRIPCPTFDEARLECYGLCVTAGNLTDDAYPENTQNFLKLMTAAHDHAMNGRYLATMASLSETCVTGGAFASGGPAYNAIVSGLSLAAIDYRARFGMCEDDILEVVAPYWTLGVVQADLARRGGVDKLSVTKAQIQAALADRGVRVQFVNDWQVRGASQFGNATKMTAWPTSANFMVYAAGTFVKGNGLSLDLGVVRDSTLNETNDHTAAWSEECHFIAKVGHESRCYTIAFDVAGDTCCLDMSTEEAGAGIL